MSSGLAFAAFAKIHAMSKMRETLKRRALGAIWFTKSTGFGNAHDCAWLTMHCCEDSTRLLETFRE